MCFVYCHFLHSVWYCGVIPVLERTWNIIHVVHFNQFAWTTQNCRMFTSRVANSKKPSGFKWCAILLWNTKMVYYLHFTPRVLIKIILIWGKLSFLPVLFTLVTIWGVGLIVLDWKFGLHGFFLLSLEIN